MQIGAKEQIAHEIDPEAPKPKEATAGYNFESALRDWVAMQEAYNSLVDSASRATTRTPPVSASCWSTRRVFSA